MPNPEPRIMTTAELPSLDQIADDDLTRAQVPFVSFVLARELLALRALVCAEDGVLMRLNALERVQRDAETGEPDYGEPDLDALIAERNEMRRERDEARHQVALLKAKIEMGETTWRSIDRNEQFGLQPGHGRWQRGKWIPMDSRGIPHGGWFAAALASATPAEGGAG